MTEREAWHAVENRDSTVTICQCPDGEHHIIHWLGVVTPSPNFDQWPTTIIADHTAAARADTAEALSRQLCEALVGLKRFGTTADGGKADAAISAFYAAYPKETT